MEISRVELETAVSKREQTGRKNFTLVVKFSWMLILTHSGFGHKNLGGTDKYLILIYQTGVHKDFLILWGGQTYFKNNKKTQNYRPPKKKNLKKIIYT